MNQSAIPEPPRCPRCHAHFTCGKLALSSASSFSCSCQRIDFTREELAWIGSLAEGECFCLDCLRALQAEFRARSDKDKAE